MAPTLTRIKVAPTGMRLNEWVAMEEGFYKDAGFAVDMQWEQLKAEQGSWDTYKERPQDLPFLKGTAEITSACAWGSVCNAGAGMGKFIPDVYGISPWAIYVRPDSKIGKPEDLRDVPIAVGSRAGSHFSVPLNLEPIMPLENIKTVGLGGFGVRLKALENGDFEAVSLLPPQVDMAQQLGFRKIMDGELKTLWWVDSDTDTEMLRLYFEVLERAEKAIQADTARYLPLWKYSNPEQYKDHAWDYSSFGRGERFVHAPLPRKDFDDIMAQVTRWGLDGHLEERAFDKLTLTVK